MKTVALHERTFEMLNDLKRHEKVESYDELIKRIILDKNKIPSSLKGSLKGKAKPFTRKEREELWKDANRE